MTDELARARELFSHYARHQGHCLSGLTQPCDCGLEAAIDELENLSHPPQERTEQEGTFWVVERFEKGHSAGYWNGGSSRSFIANIDDAVHFSRKEDAFWTTRGWHWTDTQITEHKYVTMPSSPQGTVRDPGAGLPEDVASLVGRLRNAANRVNSNVVSDHGLEYGYGDAEIDNKAADTIERLAKSLAAEKRLLHHGSVVEVSAENSNVLEYIRQLETDLERAERLEAALRKYGRHSKACIDHNTWREKGCVCGLDEALASPRAAARETETD